MGISVNSDMNDIMAQQRQWDDYQVVASENEGSRFIRGYIELLQYRIVFQRIRWPVVLLFRHGSIVCSIHENTHTWHFH